MVATVRQEGPSAKLDVRAEPLRCARQDEVFLRGFACDMVDVGGTGSIKVEVVLSGKGVEDALFVEVSVTVFVSSVTGIGISVDADHPCVFVFLEDSSDFVALVGHLRVCFVCVFGR